MATIPTSEPTSARAGDTWRWRVYLSDYLAPTWALTYTLFGSAGVETLTATDDGAGHLVYLAPADTDEFAAGRYDWVAHVSDGTDRHQVRAGAMTILPDLSDATSYDGRSHARRMLAAIEAMMEGRATDGDLDVVRTSIGDRATDYDLPSLMKLRQQYAAAVAAEDAQAAAALGGRPGIIQSRFCG